MERCTLKVGGLAPLTTIDYPGKLAAVLFCQGCPWRCHYCHNTSLQSSTAGEPFRWPAIVEFLHARRGLLDAVVFSGGEPTAQAALETAILEVKSMGYLIGLHSAGIYPRRFTRILSLLDWVGLDVKALSENYSVITGIGNSGRAAWQCVDALLESGVPCQFRIPESERLNAGDVERIKKNLQQKGAHDIVTTTLSTSLNNST